MPVRIAGILIAVAFAHAVWVGCGGQPTCGPSSGRVSRVIDGDTIELESGERIRYLLVDAPELDTGCYGDEAKQYNEDLVAGMEVSLAYDEECEDPFGRLLAYVSVGGREVNTLLVERGYACVLFIAPNGAEREEEFLVLEAMAEMQMSGMWGACPVVTCD